MNISKAVRALRDESGSELVEFALAAMIFFMVVLGIADVCRAMYSYHFVAYAAQKGSRYAMVRGSTWTGACQSSAPPNFSVGYQCAASAGDVQNYVRSLGIVNPANVNVNTTWPGTTPDCSSNCSACSSTNSPGCMVKVNVTYRFTFMVPFFKRTSVTFSANSVKVIQQ